MEKERRVKTLSLVALIIAILGLTVAFAAMSKTLTINGTANLDAATWDIHFENMEDNLSGTGKLNGDPIVTGTSVTNFNPVVTKPGDYAGIFINIVNKGTIDAKIGSIEISELCTLSSPVESCDWNNDGVVTQDDIDKVNNNISFVAQYGYDDEINGEYSDKVINENDVLKAGETRWITVILGYDKYVKVNNSYSEEDSYIEATELPARNLVFNNLSFTINYVQAD